MAKGRRTASLRTSFAFYNSAISSKPILGLKSTTSLYNILIRSLSGPAPSG
jgi:hypothetical protein